MLRRRTIAFTALGLAAALALSGCGGGGAATTENGLTIVKVIDPSAASDNLALILGHNNGTFERHGLALELVSGPQVGSNQIASLLNGQLDVGQGSVTGVMTAVTEGIPVRVASGLAADNEVDGRTLYDTLVAPDSGIASFRDLASRTVAVNSLQSTWQAAMSEAIALDGGDPATVNWVQLTFPNQLPALTQGHVDAISTTQPFAQQLLAQGYTSIGDPQAAALGDPRGVSTIIQMSQAFLDRNPDAATRFVAALQEASDYANAHPDEVRQLAVAEAGVSGEVADAIMNAPLPFYTTEMTPETVERWGALQVEYGFDETAPAPSDVLWDAPAGGGTP